MSAKPFVFDTDVLIIGGGFSGSWAALTARQHVENVLIVDKGPRDWGGLGGMSGGDMIVKQPEFAAKDLVEELVYYYDGLCEQDVLEEILNQSYERFKDYEKMGHEFARDDSGRLMSHPPARARTHALLLLPSLRQRAARTPRRSQCRAQRLNAPRRHSGASRSPISSRTATPFPGPWASTPRAARPGLFRGQGRHPQPPTTRRLEGLVPAEHLRERSGGAGLRRRGASLRNMEFIENWNVPKLFAWEGQNRMLPYGARFLNGEGEDFNAPLFPEARSQGRPALQHVRGMCLVKSGPDARPIYFDTSTMSPEGVEIMTPTGWLDETHTTPSSRRTSASTSSRAKPNGCRRCSPRSAGPWPTRTAGAAFRGLFVAGRAAQRHPRRLHRGGWDTCRTTHATGYIAGNRRGKYVSGLNLRAAVRRRPRFLSTLRRTLSLLGKPGVYHQGRGPAHAGAHGPDGRVASSRPARASPRSLERL